MIDHISHAYIYINTLYIYIINNLPRVHILRTIIINKSHTISNEIYSDRYTHPILATWRIIPRSGDNPG